MISFVTIGRNDNYGGNFLDILFKSLNYNLYEISKITDNFEYILIDWSSPNNEYLYQLDEIYNLLNKYPQFKIYNVESSVVADKGLSTDILYEYYAKNVGIRKSQGHLISTQNSDILLSPDLISNIVTLSESDPIPFVFKPQYSVGIRTTTDDFDFVSSNLEIINIKDLNQYINEDFNFNGKGFYETKFGTIDFKNPELDPLGEVASGDVLISYSNHIKDTVRGYDETNPLHSKNRQASMDSEIIHNFAQRNIKIHYLENLYFHVEHTRKEIIKDGDRRISLWQNPEGWGLGNYPVKNIQNNVFSIYK